MAGITAPSAAIRSLNADFVRKGIVVSADDDATGSGRPLLDPKILRLVETLKSSCKSNGSKEMNEISAAIQHWKERSLHHTLQTLDESRDTTTSMYGTERQIQAIELHEKAGRDMKVAVYKVLQGVVDSMLRQIDSFTNNLASTIRELLKPELEEELAREQEITKRLIEEKQRLVQERVALQESNAALQSRVESLENEPEGSGDAILCRKLRAQVNELTQQQKEMREKMTQMERDHERWRYEMAKMKTEIELQQKTLTITHAMHEKEAKQLVELVHLREDQFQQVKQATSVAMGSLTKSQRELVSYDVQSGQAICYRESSSKSPAKAAHTRLAQLPPPASPPSPRRRASTPVSSPNKKRVVSLHPSHAPSSNNTTLLELKLDGSGCTPPACAPSPRGTVRRPFSSPHE